MNNQKPETRNKKQFSFFNRFRRITYSTNYLPEIDGLRFLAIFSVVVIMHISNYIDEKFHQGQWLTNAYWKNFTTEGGNGVPLFFVISGFILSLPFAKWRLLQDKKVVLKNYYLRRLTRLEPPYLIALVILFIGYVWILEQYTFSELFPRLAASAVYLHTVIYDSFSWVLPVAWSLEVEVQFYLLAPFFCLLFLIRMAWVRWLISSFIIVAGTIFWFDNWDVPHVFMYLQFFFSGILAADLYVSGKKIIANERAGLVIGILALLGFLFLPSLHSLPGYIAKAMCMFFLIHSVLSTSAMKKIFSIKGIAIIGGMCYSIYLLHFAIISLTGNLLMRSGIDVGNDGLILLWIMTLSVVVLIISSIYFLLVEKPFMRTMWVRRGMGKGREDESKEA